MFRKFLFALAFIPLAGNAEMFEARVLNVTPVYGVREVSIPMEVCEQVQVERQGSNTAGTVLGAIAGAAIGNQFGKGSGKDVATVVGGVVGAQIGGQGGSSEVSTENRCRTVYRTYNEQSALQGYEVTYQFMNRSYSTRTNQHPGRTIRIDVYHSVVER